MGGPEPVNSGGAGSGGIGDRDLRVSDAERDHVGQLLQRAVGMGMLSLGEFTERMDTALAAKTRGELNAVLVDLPGMRLVDQPGRAAPHPGVAPHHHYRRPVPGPPRPPTTAPNVIRTRLSGVNRRGPWQVPPTLLLDNWFSSITLDFTEAVMSTQVVELRMDDYCSSLTLLVPAETTVDLDGLELVGSSVNNKVRSGPPAGRLHLVVHGSLRFGSVTAKHPFLTHWRRMLGH